MNSFSKLRQWIQKRMEGHNRTDFVILLLLGVLVMVIAIPTEGSDMKKEDTESQVKSTENAGMISETEYKSHLEEELKELLENMEGVGKCRVMLTLEDEGQTYLDKNIRQDTDQIEQSTVVYNTGDGEAPYVVRKAMPKVAGVVVVTEGGKNAVTVSNISNAVMSLFGLDAHKITVVKMSVQEE